MRVWSRASDDRARRLILPWPPNWTTTCLPRRCEKLKRRFRRCWQRPMGNPSVATQLTDEALDFPREGTPHEVLPEGLIGIVGLATTLRRAPPPGEVEGACEETLEGSVAGLPAPVTHSQAQGPGLADQHDQLSSPGDGGV